MFSDKLNEIAERYPLWTLVLVLRVPLVVVAGYALMVGDWLVEDVAFEAVRYVVLDRQYQLYLIAPLLLLAGFAIRFCGEAMIDLVTPSLRRMGDLVGFIVWILPGLLAAQIGILTGAEFIHVALNNNDFGPDPLTLVPFVPPDLNQPAAIAGAAYILIGLVICALPKGWILSTGNGFIPLLRIWNTSAHTHATAFVLLAIAVAAFVLFADWTNPKPAQDVGAFGVIALWAFAAVLFFSLPALLAHITRIPWLLVFITAALTFSAFDLNDNHEFRTVAGTAAADGTMYFQNDLSIEEWLKAREKIDLDQYDHYPVFIVVAEGGGLRSAYFTNRVLTTLQAICPYFALHTIAISGVSGGSVGAASFLAQIKNNLVPPPGSKPCNVPLQDNATDPNNTSPSPTGKPPASTAKSGVSVNEPSEPGIYDKDYLAPLLAAALFPDSLQRILWWPIQGFDRARMVECAFERSLQGALESGQQAPAASASQKPQHKMHRPCSSGSLRLGDLYSNDAPDISLPYLFLNTTSVTTGAPVPIATRVVKYPWIKSAAPGYSGSSVQSMMNGIVDSNILRPIEIDPDASPFMLGVPDPPPKIEHPRDVPLATAAFLSARFPFILPPARFPVPEQNPAYVERLLDGGLFENSGTWFAKQIAWKILTQTTSGAAEPGDDRLRRVMQRMHIHVLIIRSTPCSVRSWPSEGSTETVARKVGECSADLAPNQTIQGLSELSSPARALLNTRVARGYAAQINLTELAEDHNDRIFVSQIRFANLHNVHIPLTWTMSRESRRLMDEAVAELQPDHWESLQERLPLGPVHLQQERSLFRYRRSVCALIDTIAKDDCPSKVKESILAACKVARRDDQIALPERPAPKCKPKPDPLPALPELDSCENCDPKRP